MAKKLLEFDRKQLGKPADRFGGELLKSHPKTKRPLATKLPMHLVLRANQGGMRTGRAFALVNDAVYDLAKKYGIRIYSYANVGNHLHINAVRLAA